MKLLLAVHKRLPLGEASVTVGRAGEREKKTRGDDGKGKEKPRAFYFFDKSHNALLLFSIIAIFTGIPSRSHCRGERFYQYSNFVLRVNYCFLQYEPLIGSNKLSRNVFDNFL